MYARKYCTNNPGYKIYRCRSARSTQHYTLLHTPTILHMKTFFAPACHPGKKKYSRQNCCILHWYTQDPITYHRPLQNTIQTNIFFFPSLGLGLELGLWLRLWSNRSLACNRYVSLHATKQVACYFYFYVLREYYHTNKDRRVLDNPYSLQVLSH